MYDLLGEVNQTIRALAAKMDPRDSSRWQFVCECGTAECTERVDLSLAQYDTLKAADDALLAPGHRLKTGSIAAQLAAPLQTEAAS